MKKKGQVWVETVTYTMVAFVLIGLILSFAKPKIEEFQDQTIIQQSVQMLKDIDAVIQEVQEEGVGNKRKIEIDLRKGDLEINSTGDDLIFTMESRFMYSQPGQKFTDGSLVVLTGESGKDYFITLEKNYEDYNLTYSGKEISKKISKGSNSYVFYISNEGGVTNNIDFELG